MLLLLKRQQITELLINKYCGKQCFNQMIKNQCDTENIFSQFSSVQSLSRVRLFATPWIAALQASLSITNSQSLLKLMSIELVMASSHLILCHPLLLLPPIPPASGSFQMSQLFAWGGQSIGVSASASVLPMNIQDWSPLGWTGWISIQPNLYSTPKTSEVLWKTQSWNTISAVNMNVLWNASGKWTAV